MDIKANKEHPFLRHEYKCQRVHIFKRKQAQIRNEGK